MPRAAAADDLLPPAIIHEPCEFYQKKKKVEIIARFRDESAIFDPKVIFRSRSRRWTSVPFKKVRGSDDIYKTTIKSRQLKGLLEYFIEVFDENGNGPARYGSQEAPVRIEPSKKKVRCIQVPEEVEKAPPSAQAEPVAVPAAPEPPAPVMTAVAETTTPPEGVPGRTEAEAEPAKVVAEKPEAPSPAAETAPEVASAEVGAGAGAEVEVEAEAEAEAEREREMAIAATGPDTGPSGAETIEASAAEGAGALVIAPPPEPAKTGCDAPEPPLYCSPVLWTVVGGSVAAVGGTIIGIYLGVSGSQGPPDDGRDPLPPFNIRISGPDPRDALTPPP